MIVGLWSKKVNSPLASKSYLIRLRTAAHGRSVFSKQRHHSRVDKLPSLSASQVSMNGLMHLSFWSCSRSKSSDVDSDPSLLMSKWPNIHLASILHAAGKWAAFNFDSLANSVFFVSISLSLSTFVANTMEFECVSPSDLAMRRFCFFVSVIITENQSKRRFPMVVSSCGWHSLTANGKFTDQSNENSKKIQAKIEDGTFAWAESFARSFDQRIVHAIVVIQSASGRIGAIIRTAHKWCLFTTWACFALPTERTVDDKWTTSVI